MPQDDSRTVIWLTETNAVSGLAAVVEDDGRSCWLYLLAGCRGAILKRVLVYSVIPPISGAGFSGSAQNGDAPVLIAYYASARAVITERYPDDFSFRWRPDGKAVAVMFREEVFAIVAREEEQGHSLAIASSGPFGSPLMPEHFKWLEKTA